VLRLQVCITIPDKNAIFKRAIIAGIIEKIAFEQNRGYGNMERLDAAGRERANARMSGREALSLGNPHNSGGSTLPLILFYLNKLSHFTYSKKKEEECLEERTSGHIC
jgi:hypothetical protein